MIDTVVIMDRTDCQTKRTLTHVYGVVLIIFFLVASKRQNVKSDAVCRRSLHSGRGPFVEIFTQLSIRESHGKSKSTCAYFTLYTIIGMTYISKTRVCVNGTSIV